MYSVAPAQRKGESFMARVFIIAGHGAGDPGAVGNGYQEAERVRALANRIKALGGDNVMLGDTSRNWYEDRGISSLSIPKDYQIVELHMDSNQSASPHGGHVVIYSGYSPDAYDTALANFIGSILPGRASLIVGRSDLANPKRAANRGYGYRLIECGFITNAEDVNTFNSRMDELATGILASFGIGTANTGWVLDDIGWWYRDAGGSYPVSCWRQIGNDWYYFDSRGYAVSGQWIQDGGHWYYLKEDCRMVTGWRKVDGIWYYLNPQSYSGHPLGSMLDGWQYVGNYWYYLNQRSGEEIPHGGMLTGMLDVGDHTYYCRPKADGHQEGSMATGWLKLEDSWYYCNKDNDCQPVGSIFKNHWHEENGERYYLKDDGKMACDETLVISGKEYSFDSSGKQV